MTAVGSITVDLRPGDRLQLGQAVVEFQHKSGRAARLCIQAPRDVPVRREVCPERDKNDAPPVRANHGTMNTEG